MSVTDTFDYEAAVWGEDDVRPEDRSIAAFRVHEARRFLPVGGRVIEVGCGAGRMLRALQMLRPDLRLCGADVSRAALERAHARSPALEFRTVEGAGAAFPARDGEFDAVLLLDVLEHVEDPARFLAEVRRVLTPQGVLHLHVPCEGDWRSLWRWLPGQSGPRGWKRRMAGHVQRFTRSDALKLVHEAGFQVLRTRHSLHVLGNFADVGAFAALAWGERRAGPNARRRTTGDLLAAGARPAGEGPSGGSRLVRAADASLFWEARVLGRFPSWGLHASARVRAARPEA